MDYGEEMERIKEKPSAIDVSDLSFTYRKGKRVLESVSFSIAQGDVLTILGPNGSGKTTLLNCLLMNNMQYSGKICLFGRDLRTYQTKEYASSVAYVPQLARLNFEYTVEDFVLMGINPHKSFFEQPQARDYAMVYKSLELLGIRNLSAQLMGEISGGERQLAYIARALTQQPKIIIMDEPTSALDYSNQYKVIQILKRLNQDGYTVILTSHNPEYAFMLGGYVGMIYRNERFQFGPAEELMNDDNLSKLYGTDIRVKYLPEYNTKICVRVDGNREWQ